MKKTVIDSSSAILLFKAGCFAPFLERYEVVMPGDVYREITLANYPGADAFARDADLGRIAILERETDAPWEGRDAPALDRGERAVIGLFLGGIGDFIVIDDGRGANFCRQAGIPYINALLVPRIFYLAGIYAAERYRETQEALVSLGRYAAPVIDYARDCPAEKLLFFFP